MILWTIQNEKAYKSLEEKGTLMSFWSNILDDDFLYAYDWMRIQMNQKIGNPPKNDCYPIWAWYQYEGIRKRPDMRQNTHSYNHTKEKIYLLTIDIP